MDVYLFSSLLQNQFSLNGASTSCPAKRPFSLKKDANLETPSEVRIFEHSKDDYTMVSKDGVLSTCRENFDFVSLERFEEEYQLHRKLVLIPFFARFKLFKPFYIWHKKVCAKKMHVAQQALKENLFMINPVSRENLSVLPSCLGNTAARKRMCSSWNLMDYFEYICHCELLFIKVKAIET